MECGTTSSSGEGNTHRGISVNLQSFINKPIREREGCWSSGGCEAAVSHGAAEFSTASRRRSKRWRSKWLRIIPRVHGLCVVAMVDLKPRATSRETPLVRLTSPWQLTEGTCLQDKARSAIARTLRVARCSTSSSSGWNVVYSRSWIAGGSGGCAAATARASRGADARERRSAASSKSYGAPPCGRAGEANEQHYEVPAEFFVQVLGSRLKYSSCYWSPAWCHSTRPRRSRCASRASVPAR